MRAPFPAAVDSYLLSRSHSLEALEQCAAAAGRLAGKLLTGLRSTAAAQELLACLLAGRSRQTHPIELQFCKE